VPSVRECVSFYILRGATHRPFPTENVSLVLSPVGLAKSRTDLGCSHRDARKPFVFRRHRYVVHDAPLDSGTENHEPIYRIVYTEMRLLRCALVTAKRFRFSLLCNHSLINFISHNISTERRRHNSDTFISVILTCVVKNSRKK